MLPLGSYSFLVDYTVIQTLVSQRRQNVSYCREALFNDQKPPTHYFRIQIKVSFKLKQAILDKSKKMQFA